LVVPILPIGWFLLLVVGGVGIIGHQPFGTYLLAGDARSPSASGAPAGVAAGGHRWTPAFRG
jgi:hypothetical protein